MLRNLRLISDPSPAIFSATSLATLKRFSTDPSQAITRSLIHFQLKALLIERKRGYQCIVCIDSTNGKAFPSQKKNNWKNICMWRREGNLFRKIFENCQKRKRKQANIDNQQISYRFPPSGFQQKLSGVHDLKTFCLRKLKWQCVLLNTIIVRPSARPSL